MERIKIFYLDPVEKIITRKNSGKIHAEDDDYLYWAR